MATILREAIDALRRLPKDEQQRAARVIIDYADYQNCHTYAQGL